MWNFVFYYSTRRISDGLKDIVLINQYFIQYIILFLGISSYQVNGQPLCPNNPSFEGTSQPHIVPAPWINCGRFPDTQPGQWGITQPASNGSTYVSFLLIIYYLLRE